MKLPQEFVDRMNIEIKSHEVPIEGFWESFDSYPRKGLRLNRSKVAFAEREKILGLLNVKANNVSWCDGGYYLSENDDVAGKDPFYHAGVYYPQEPSAMLPAQVMAVKKGDYVLDLCSAPGGKACRLAEDLDGEGLLVANEINETRAKALLRNIERMGITNCVIVNETPENLASRFDCFFDKILVDAPCSGEGMFRRDPFAVKSWEKFGPEVCIKMQEEILDSAHKMLKVGGELVYSTCTFCYGEDEGQILNFLSKYPGYEVISHPEITGVTHASNNSKLPGSMRIWPHVSDGDGHFCIHLRKTLDTRTNDDVVIDYSFVSRKRNDNYSYTMSRQAMLDFAKDIFTANAFDAFSNLVKEQFVFHKNKIHLLGVSEKTFDKLKVVKMGNFPGEIKETTKGRVFIPSHCFALTLKEDDIDSKSKLVLHRDDDRLARYLRGETISVDSSEKSKLKKKGYIVIVCEQFPIGFGKIAPDGNIKNLYPRAWVN